MVLTAKHYAAMRALLEGEPILATARKLGITQQTLYLWRREPTFQDAFDKMRNAMAEQVTSIIQGRLAQEAEPALNRIVYLRDNARLEKVSLDASRDLLDRAGFKAIDVVHEVHEHVLSPEFAELIRGVLREKETVDGTVIDCVTQLPERTSPQ